MHPAGDGVGLVVGNCTVGQVERRAVCVYGATFFQCPVVFEGTAGVARCAGVVENTTTPMGHVV